MRLQIKRLISQLIFFFTANLGAVGIKSGFCFPFFYCHACPVSSAACPLRSLEISVYRIYKEPGNFNIKFLLYPLLILFSVGIVTGRAVCGWACPFGLLQRATGRIARKIHKKIPALKRFQESKIDGYLRYAKYFILIGLIFITPIFIGFMFTDICPNGFLFGSIPVMLLNPGKYIPATYFYIALVILILFFILIFTVERGWCRYFCPVGAILAPFNKVSFLHVEVEGKECIHCNACSNVCPMSIDIPNMDRDPECILCGKCISACPKNGIKFKKV
jgi:polyferredoxin